MSWKTILRTALLIGPPEGHGPCQQASMTSHRQCGTAEGCAVHCRHQGDDEGASQASGENRMPIKWHWDLCQPERHRQPCRVPQLRQLQGGQHGQTTGHCFAPLGTFRNTAHRSLSWVSSSACEQQLVPKLPEVFLHCSGDWALIEVQLWPLLGPLRLKQRFLPQLCPAVTGEWHWGTSGLSNTGLRSNVLHYPQKLLIVPQATGQHKC